MKQLLKYIHKKYPTYGEKNIFWFYIVSGLGNSWFQIGNWLLFVLLFMSEGQFAIYEATAFAIGILLEIPSGAFADLVGKKVSIILGYSLVALGSILFVLAFLGVGYIFVGNILIIAGFAFISGSLQALVYDTLVENNKVEHYDDIIGKGLSLDTGFMIATGLIGGIAWIFSPYAPMILTAGIFVLATLASAKLQEPSVDTETFSWSRFVAQNKRGFYFLFKSPFRKYTFSMAMISGTYLMWGTGIIRILMGRDFGYNGETINYLIVATLIASFVAAYYFKTIRKKLGDTIGYGSLIIIAAIGWLLAAIFTNSIFAGVIVFFALTVSANLAELWSSVILNAHVHSKDRATAISTLSFLIQIPYVVVAVLFGWLVTNDAVTPFYFITGAILFLAAGIFFYAEKSSSKPVKS